MKYDTLILAERDGLKIQKAKEYGVQRVIISEDIITDQSINPAIAQAKSPAIWLSNKFVGKSQKFMQDWLFEKILYNKNIFWWGKSYTNEYIERTSPDKIATFATPITVPDFDSDIFLHEIQNIKHMFTNRHGKKNATWLSFSIHGETYDQHQVKEKDGYKNLRWTPEACELIPNITEYFQNLNMHENYGLISIKLLKPGGFINIHRDEGFHTLPVNIAINNPPGCVMHMWDSDFSYNGIVDFTTTGAVELNVNKYHYVHNNSEIDRYHVIVHALPLIHGA
jgi:hypothetical protein